jgi:hypothetical protein
METAKNKYNNKKQKQEKNVNPDLEAELAVWPGRSGCR